MESSQSAVLLWLAPKLFWKHNISSKEPENDKSCSDFCLYICIHCMQSNQDKDFANVGGCWGLTTDAHIKDDDCRSGSLPKVLRYRV